jgi:hypothetical protein
MSPLAELKAQLHSHRTTLLDAAESVPLRLRGVSPVADRWSVLHVLEHCARVDGIITSLLQGMLPAAPLLGARVVGAGAGAGPGAEAVGAEPAASTTVGRPPRPGRLGLVADRSRRVNAVPGSEPVGGMEYDQVERMLAGARADLLTTVDSAADRDLDRTTRAHPLLGPLSIRQWIIFAGLHDARHAGQIAEIRGQIGVFDPGPDIGD